MIGMNDALMAFSQKKLLLNYVALAKQIYEQRYVKIVKFWRFLTNQLFSFPYSGETGTFLKSDVKDTGAFQMVKTANPGYLLQ